MISFGDLVTPKNGYAIRCWTMAQRLADEGNDVTVYQYASHDGETTKAGITIRSLKVRHETPSKSFLNRTLGFAPFKEMFFPFDSYFKLKAHKKDLQVFDEFYIELCLLIGPIVLVKKMKKRMVIDTHLLNKDLALKMKKAHKIQGTIRALIWHAIEKHTFSRADELIAISGPDKEFIEKHYHIADNKIVVIPHEVEAAAVDKYAEEAEELKQKYLSGYKFVACFLGDLRAVQNKESESFILTKLAPATPDVHYILVGNNPSEHRSKGNVTYTGFVDAIDPYIMLADFCIAPMTIGSGIKTKVLDYIKYGKRIIATPVALEGIEETNNVYRCDIDNFVSTIKNQIEVKA